MRHHPRAVLSEKEAIEIYQYRTAAAQDSAMRDACLHGKSSAVAKQYNISPKAVRDIWNRRTWTQETRHLWSEDEKPMARSGVNCMLSRSSSGSSTASAHVEWWTTPSSPDCILLGSEAWTSVASIESRSVYATDTDPISHFYMQAALQSTLQSGTMAKFCSPTSDRCEMSQTSFGADNWQRTSTIVENTMWEAEWGDGPLAGEVSDPFFTEWPVRPNQTKDL
jgi:hypothetical protein